MAKVRAQYETFQVCPILKSVSISTQCDHPSSVCMSPHVNIEAPPIGKV